MAAQEVVMLVKSSMFMLLGATLIGGVAICDWCETPTALAATAPAAEQAGTAHALNAQAPVTPTHDSLQKVTLHVEGMTCGGCTLATRKVLTRLDGVEKAVVTYQPPRAVVTFDPRKVTVPQMIAAIKTLGYRSAVAS
jgi:copper chaperone CopZ